MKKYLNDPVAVFGGIMVLVVIGFVVYWLTGGW
jgi:hypothetical protein